MSLILRQCRGVNNAEYHKDLRDEFLRLLRKSRDKINVEIWPPEEYCWRSVSDEFLYQYVYSSKFEHTDIFQPHRGVKLNVVSKQREEAWESGY